MKIFSDDYQFCPLCGHSLETVYTGGANNRKVCGNPGCIYYYTPKLIEAAIKGLEEKFEIQLSELHQKIDDLRTELTG